MSKRALAARDLSNSELHSRAELECLGALLNIVRGGKLAKRDIRDAVKCGNNTLLTDACFDDPRGVGGTLAFEYDEEYWHRDRVAKDVAKSARQLAHPGVTRLLRVRRGRAAWGGRSIAARVGGGAAYCEALVESTKPIDQARAACEALGVPFDAAAAARGAELGALAYYSFDEDRKLNLARIKAACGPRAAVHVAMKTRGVQMQLWDDDWVEGLLRFRSVVGHRHLCTELSDSVAAKLTDEAWFAGLARLAEAVGGAQHLRTALLDGVAARLTDEAFHARAGRLIAAAGQADAARVLGRNCATVRLARVVAAVEAAPPGERGALCRRASLAPSRSVAALQAVLVGAGSR